MCQSFQDGRAETNPAEHWYDNELQRFDLIVIPLAQKLQGILVNDNDRYLHNAATNRQQWEIKGRGLVEAMLESMAARGEL